MSYQVNFTQSNREDFAFFFNGISTIDGTDIDFTGADVQFAISDDDGCVRISAALASNTYVTLPIPTRLKVLVPATPMQCFCPGTYRVGMTYSLNGETVQLIDGNLSIYDGVVRR
jgi:hypothetical protein